MRQKLHLIIFISIAAVLMVCCTGKGGTVHTVQASDTLYTEARAMSFMAHEPKRAFQIIDSTEMVGNLTDFRADMLRAKVYSRTYEALRTDSAIVIGERLMLHDSIKADYDIRQDVLEILQDAYRMDNSEDEREGSLLRNRFLEPH